MTSQRFLLRALGMLFAASAVALPAAATPASASAAVAPESLSGSNAGSILFVRNNQLWISGPNGSQQTKLNDSRKFAQPSQSDSGAIIAISDDNRYYRFTRAGVLIGDPVLTWLGLNGGSGFAGPYRARLSPDGSKIAYSWFHTQPIDPTTGQIGTVGGVGYTYADHYTDPNSLGLIKGWNNPSWLDNMHTMAFNPTIYDDPDNPGPTTVVFHELGHADPNKLDDLEHAYTWFTDLAATALLNGEITRAGDKIAAGYDGFDATRTVRLYSVSEHPVAGVDTAEPTYRCDLHDAPGDGYENLSWSPDGQDLAYQAAGNIYVVHIGDIGNGCSSIGTPTMVVANGENPSWGAVAVGSTVSTPPTPAGSSYVPLVPERLLETRASEVQRGYSGARPSAGQTVVLKVTTVGGSNVPASASAVVLNVAGTNVSADGFVTVWPCGSPRPLAANLNLAAGVTSPNVVVSKVGANGTVCLFTQSGGDLIADINGYYPVGSSYVPLVPERILETRLSDGQRGYVGARPNAGQIVELQVTGVGSSHVPADALAVVLNVAGTNVSADGFVTVWPCGSPRPLAANLNLAAGVTSPNAVIAKVGVAGKVCLFTQNGGDLIADINGFFPAGSSYVPLVPERLLETRASEVQRGYSGARPSAGQTVVLKVTTVGGSNVPADASAVVLNVAGTNVSVDGFVTVWPCGSPRPLAANLNLAAGVTSPNVVVSKVGVSGTVCLFTQNGGDLIADINGYFPST